MLFARKKFDPEPTEPIGVMLATASDSFSDAAIRTVINEAAGRQVSVLAILRVYGSQFGLPNPGLLPNKQEREKAYGVMEEAMAKLEDAGLEVDGQIAITRAIAKKITEMTVLRQATVLVMDDSPEIGLRRKMEGDITGGIAKRLPSSVKFCLLHPAKHS